MDENQNQRNPEPYPPPQAANPPARPPVQPLESADYKPAWQAEAMRHVWQQDENAGQTQGGSQPQGYQPYPSPTSPPTYNGATPPPLPPQPSSVATPGSNDVYAAQPSAKKHNVWLWAIFFLILLIGAGIGAIFYLTSSKAPNPEALLKDTLTQALKTQTYQEITTTQAEQTTTTATRWADFRKLDTPAIYIDNLAPKQKDNKTEVTIIGNDYYVKKHFTNQELKKSEPKTQAVLSAINDQWVLVIDDNKAVESQAAKVLDLTKRLRNLKVVVPSVFPIGYLSDENQQTVQGFLQQHQVYTLASDVVEENLDGTPVWRLDLSVDAKQLQPLTTEIAKVLGKENPQQSGDALKGETPELLQVWTRKDDAQVLQFSYTLDGSVYTHRFQAINSDVRVDTPQIAPPAALNATDQDIKIAMREIADSLDLYRRRGNLLPANETTFNEFVEQRVSDDTRQQFALSYKKAKPSKGYIYYQNAVTCTAQNGTFKKGDSEATFALLTALTNSQYCITNDKGE